MKDLFLKVVLKNLKVSFARSNSKWKSKTKKNEKLSNEILIKHFFE